jgi:hypothetical protein
MLHLQAVDSMGMDVVLIRRGHEVRTDKEVGHRRAKLWVSTRRIEAM